MRLPQGYAERRQGRAIRGVMERGCGAGRPARASEPNGDLSGNLFEPVHAETSEYVIVDTNDNVKLV